MKSLPVTDRKSTAPLAITAPIFMSKSRFIHSGRRVTGATNAIMPIIPSILKMFDPKIVPTPTGVPCHAEVMLMASSGSDVPIPTMTTPTSHSETPKKRAIDVAPRITKSAPFIKIKNPSINRNTDNNMENIDILYQMYLRSKENEL